MYICIYIHIHMYIWIYAQRLPRVLGLADGQHMDFENDTFGGRARNLTGNLPYTNAFCLMWISNALLPGDVKCLV